MYVYNYVPTSMSSALCSTTILYSYVFALGTTTDNLNLLHKMWLIIQVNVYLTTSKQK